MLTMSNMQQRMGRVHRWTVGDRLRAARAAVTNNQTDFADMIGIARRTVTAYEANTAETVTESEIRMKRPYLQEWARVSGFDLDWILTGIEPAATPDGDGTVVNIGRGNSAKYSVRPALIAA